MKHLPAVVMRLHKQQMCCGQPCSSYRFAILLSGVLSRVRCQWEGLNLLPISHTGQGNPYSSKYFLRSYNDAISNSFLSSLSGSNSFKSLASLSNCSSTAFFLSHLLYCAMANFI